MYTVTVKIVGVAPLLQNRFPTPDEQPKTRRRSGEIKDDWKQTAYLLPGTTELVQPGIHIETAMAKTATQFRIAGRGKKTYKDLVQSAVIVEPELIPHHLTLPDDLITDPTQPVYIDRRPVVIQRGRLLKSRVALKAGWTLDFVIRVLDDQIPDEILREILETAGASTGIGDFRPKYGRFEVKEFIIG